MPARLQPLLALVVLALVAGPAAAAETNTVLYGASSAAGSAATPPDMDVGASLTRVFGALVVVIALFFGAVWFYRNWQGMLARKHGGTRLNLVEVRSLGNKQSLVVVGYGSQRLLVGASPAGISLVTHLPAEEISAEVSPEPASPSNPPRFMDALQQVLNRRNP